MELIIIWSDECWKPEQTPIYTTVMVILCFFTVPGRMIQTCVRFFLITEQIFPKEVKISVQFLTTIFRQKHPEVQT